MVAVYNMSNVRNRKIICTYIFRMVIIHIHTHLHYKLEVGHFIQTGSETAHLMMRVPRTYHPLAAKCCEKMAKKAAVAHATEGVCLTLMFASTT